MVYLFSSVEMDFDGTWVSFCFVFGLSLQVCVRSSSDYHGSLNPVLYLHLFGSLNSRCSYVTEIFMCSCATHNGYLASVC